MDKAMMAAQLRQEKREDSQGDEDGNDSGAARSPRYDTEAREAEADELMSGGGGQGQGKKEDDGVGMLNAPSAGALRWSWLAIIPSFGFSLLYTNLHAFMRLIFPKFFCELGSEWFVGPMKVMGSSNGGQMAKMGEKMLLVMIDLLLFLLLILIISIIVVIYDALSGVLGWFLDLFS